jgi:hypothetical protein
MLGRELGVKIVNMLGRDNAVFLRGKDLGLRGS